MKSKEDSDGKRYHEQIAVVGGATNDKKVGFYARLEDAEILNWVYDVAFGRHGTYFLVAYIFWVKWFCCIVYLNYCFYLPSLTERSNTMLIVSDEEMTTEIYDLEESECNKRGPSFPIKSNHTGRYFKTVY